MIGIALHFPCGRFHATPWGRHVNEGATEWPPSPWRLLRALVATWKRKLEDQIAQPDARDMLAQLLEPPTFVLPQAGTGHARHYMPWFKKGPDDRTLVFDAFVVLPKKAEILVFWPNAAIAEVRRHQLAAILANLNFFGRAESWCSARLLSDQEASQTAGRVNCRPTNEGGCLSQQELIRVLCADDGAAFANDAFEKMVSRKVRGKPVDSRERTAPLYDPDWHLCAETAWLHKERWSDPPGSRWVSYTRLRDCFQVRPVRRARQHGLRPQVARFALDSAVLPLVTDALPIAEATRRHLMGIYGRMFPVAEGQPARSEVFSGKDHLGQPLAGHRHSYYLPTDEDGDGRLDHITVVAEGGFGPEEMQAMDKFCQLNSREREASGHPLRTIWMGWGRLGDYSAGPLAPAMIWRSATPFLAPRYAKPRGTKRDPPDLLGNPEAFLQAVLREELARWLQRHPELASLSLDQIQIQPLADKRIPRSKSDPHGLRPVQFARWRQKKGDDGGRRPAGAYRLIFPIATRGPICLGHSAHFGLGLFMPDWA